MLAKLMKYELKATARWFLPLYAAVLFLAALNRFLFGNPNYAGGNLTVIQIASHISMVLYIIVVIGIMAVTLVVSIQRFYKNLLGDEGYLMFTLPVSTWKHILNKLLIAMLWNLLSGLIATFSIVIMVRSADLPELAEFYNEIYKYMGTVGLVTIPVMTLVSIAFSILQIYAAIALGHLFGKHRLLASFGMYLAINTVFQFIAILLLPIFAKVFLESFSADLIVIFSKINTILVVITAVMIAASAACFVLTNILLKKRLNLE